MMAAMNRSVHVVCDGDVKYDPRERGGESVLSKESGIWVSLEKAEATGASELLEQKRRCRTSHGKETVDDYEQEQTIKTRTTGSYIGVFTSYVMVM